MKTSLFSCFLLLLALSAGAQTDYSDYKMAGPYEVVARDGQYRASKGGSERDMKTALLCAQAGQTEKALEIIEAYARTLQRFDGHDAPLCCIQAYWLVRAMTIVKNERVKSEKSDSPSAPDLHAADQSHSYSSLFTLCSSLIRRAILPTIDKFEADSPYANGNWGAIVNRCRMACAIFLEDSVLYQAAIDYYLRANDNGSLPRYIGPTGQCQETGRDQGHVQLGLGALVETCVMAEEQGTDLWSALDNRLMHGLEYTARYNLGHDVPFEQWTDCTGLYNEWTEPGAMGRGLIRDIYQPAYEHYALRKGQKMPYVKKLLALQKKAERRGEVHEGLEVRDWRVPGVVEGKKLHQVFTYPAPDGAPLKHDYEVYVQPRGSKEWTRIDTYMAKVNAPRHPSVETSLSLPTGGHASGSPMPLAGGGQGASPWAIPHKVSEISYAMFDFTGDVFVRVVSKHKKYKNARVRPDYRGVIAQELNDSTVQFLLFQPENVSVELDGDITSNLLVFTSRPPVSKERAEQEAKAQGRTFRYYAPGYHTEQDTIYLPSNTTVYLAGGAYFTGTFAIEDAHDVSILGRGIARPARGYEGCRVRRSRNVLVDGMVVNTCPVGGSENITLHDVRSISHPGWGDGLNVFASSNVLYDRVFCRNSDDCTTVYATRKGFEGSARNIHMRNSTLWADVAHPIFIGLHGAAAGPHPERRDTVENLTYENLDILCQSEPQVDYQGCLAINAGDNNLVRNILFDNVRIESLCQGSILHVKVGWNQKYCKAPGLGVENVTFRNVRYSSHSPLIDASGRGLPYMSVINGYDEQRKVRNITFEGLKINGRTIYDEMPGKPRWYATSDYVPLFVGNHVEGLVFKK